MVRLEVQEYMRASAKLFGLAYEERAVTPAERAVIISFAQELERRFLPAREEGRLAITGNLLQHKKRT